MFSEPDRICARGKFPLQDWLVSVVYQQEPLDFSFAAEAPKTAERETTSIFPLEVQDEENPYGFIGRDGPILELERAMRRKTPAILIHGLGGVGKTTLARGFVKWLEQTQGLGQGCFWFAFNEIRSAEFVFNRMEEALFGGNFSLAELGQRIEALAGALNKQRYIIVWDNFEVARGIPGTEVKAFLSDQDLDLLLKFLRRLRGGRSKVLITNRSEEDWLGVDRRKVGVSGLSREKRWLFLEEILGTMDLAINRDDPDLIKLMNLLNGHPLSMRVILPILEKQSAASAAEELQSGMAAMNTQQDEANAHLHATLGFAQTALPEELQPLLIPLGMHERFVDLNYLEAMAKQVDDAWTRELLNRFAEAMVYMGLLYDRGNGIYEIHPALTGYLRAIAPEKERTAWAPVFVDVMGGLANHFAQKEFHEQRASFHLLGASLYYAINLAEMFQMGSHIHALLQFLAIYAQNSVSFSEANDLFERLALASKISGENEGKGCFKCGLWSCWILCL